MALGRSKIDPQTPPNDPKDLSEMKMNYQAHPRALKSKPNFKKYPQNDAQPTTHHRILCMSLHFDVKAVCVFAHEANSGNSCRGTLDYHLVLEAQRRMHPEIESEYKPPPPNA